ncbi:MAG: beta-ketoacyl-ACP synthase III [Arenicellales bacterium]|jgi:beta-ketodecanoyl-[acyl-carrier-protein] synthase|nr:beta-ketoacyl-ACP synthase III [Arenicellales bacterium]MDP7283480.1 beta-ketoacyl-ACP synthase III [Arenicellales bacterium]MEE1539662.1 beta-ketoacyl-ACP synthase III [Arenicellales bacterium]
MNNPTIVISGTGLFTPSELITNEELVESFNKYAERFNSSHHDQIGRGDLEAIPLSSVEFIEKASGITKRYVIDKRGILDPEVMAPQIAERTNDQQSLQCEISVAAAQQALEGANRQGGEIDAVIVACSNMQRPYPAMAIEVQEAIGAQGFAYDMNVACSSATFGMQAAYNAIISGSASRVLVVNPEICSAHLDWEDRDCHFIFGDVCTAIILERESEALSDHRWEILGTKLSTQYSNNIRNNFGFLNRCDPAGIGKPDKLFKQNGRKVFKEVCPMVAQLITDHLGELNIKTSDLSRMWLHQANLSMNRLISKKVLGKEPTEQEAPVILNHYANTSSAGSIIAFHLYNADLKNGDLGIICSFGAGYSIGSIIIKKQM